MFDLRAPSSTDVPVLLLNQPTIKTERTQIHFLSDVLVAVASLDLKVSISVDCRKRIKMETMTENIAGVCEECA